MTSVKGRYARIEIPLDTAESGKELHVTGDYLSIISVTGEGSCEIKLDHRHSQTIDFREISGITGPFDRLYFTTNGAGGICSIFVGTGIAINITPIKENLWSGVICGAHLRTQIGSVLCLASESVKLEDVTILNTDPAKFCYVGPYSSNLATFKTYAYLLLGYKTLKFRKADMYSLGCSTVNEVDELDLHIIGRYE